MDRRRRGGTFVLLTLAAMLVLPACDPPGKGPRAERGYRRADPVIRALAAYRDAHGSYPAALAELVPRYLPAQALAVPRREQEAYPLAYTRTATGYELSFRYAGPGMNECTYRVPPGAWECGGYF
jgi:hypothetical protein